mgnify:CR=1 FL=1
MFDVALLMFLQVSAASAAPQDQAPAAQVQAAEDDKDKVVCTMEPITGTRAKKQQVCKTKGYEKGSEKYRDMLGAIQRASNVGPGEPPAQGVRPGGPADRAGVREGERFSNLSFTPGEPTERATATLDPP